MTEKNSRNNKFTKSRIIIAGFAVSYLLLIFGTAFWIGYHNKNILIKHFDQQATVAAKSLKYMLAPDFHDRALNKNSIPREEELKNRRAFSGFANDSKFIYVYTLVKKDGKFYFSSPTVTPEEAKQQSSWYFHPYNDIPPEMVKAYDTGKTVSISYSDQWGHFRTVAIPETSPAGRKYLSCVDYPTEKINWRIREIYLWSFLIGLLFVLPLIPLLMIYRSKLSELNKFNRKLSDDHKTLEQQISERTEALEKTEKALEDLERRLYLMIEEASIGVYDFYLPSMRIDTNPICRKITGYDGSETLKNHQEWLAVIHPDDLETVKNQLEAHLNNETPVYRLTYRLKKESGQWCWLQDIGKTVQFDEKGNPSKIVGIIQDISEVKYSEERSRFLSESTVEAVIVHENGILLEANRSFFKMFDYSESEIIGKSILEFIPREICQIPPDSKDGFVFETTAYRKDHSEIPLEIHVSPSVYQDKNINVATLYDISNRKEVEKQLIKAREYAESVSQAKNEFISKVSHELRTPMNGIMGMIQLLKNTGLSREQKDYVETVMDSAYSMLSIIDDLLDIARIEKGIFKVVPEEGSLKKTLEFVFKMFKLEAKNKNLELKFIYDPKLPENFLCDHMRIRQIVINLVGNALKFTERGSITIACKLLGEVADKTTVEISISDTGIGIPPDRQKAIFKRFVQADNSSTRQYGGCGLGLAITQDVVKILGGKIQLKSNTGEGSTFTVQLPVSPVAPHPDQMELKLEYSSARKQLKALVVDDNRINRLVAQKLLSQTGIEVVTANDGYEAVALAIEQQFDIIFIDIDMPVMDGLEATRQIRSIIRQSNYMKMPVIIAMTGHVMESDRQACMNAGMNDFLCKPIENDILMKIINSYFG